MTQPTIKEKAFEIMQHVDEETLMENSWIEEFMRRFARLICEEMKSTTFGATRERIEKKAQEILKALE